jgi:anti-sigma factor RsiW
LILLVWPHPRQKHLLAFLTGNLEQSQHARLESHIGGCVRCRRECARLDAALRAYDAGRPDVSSQLLAAGRAALTQAGQTAPPQRSNEQLAALVGIRLASEANSEELDPILESFLGRRGPALRRRISAETPR